MSQHPSNYRLVLASQSPRRAQLLQQAGYQFTVLCPPSEVEEQAVKDLPAAELVVELARAKGAYVAQLLAQQAQIADERGEQPEIPEEIVVLAADTVAQCQGVILGKPIDRADAERMLRLMRGREHRVLTAVSLWSVPHLTHIDRMECSSLLMDSITEAALTSYLDSGDWEGKAGAFGYQDGLDWVHIVQGLASTVVGLPVEHLQDWIHQLQTLKL